MTDKLDLVIIGGGPGGYVAAIRATQLGMRVALVEREHLGGVCLNWGCIPTKALLRNAEVARLVSSGGKEFGFSAENVALDYGAAVDRSRKIAARLVKGVELLLEKSGVEVFWGTGRLTAPHTVEITAEDDTTQTLEAEHIILATGSRARLIPGVAADGERVLTAREALERRALPASAIIIGAGPIGLEFATVWSAYGTEVTVVEMMEQVLPAEDPEAAQALSRALRRQKIKARTSTRVEGIETTADGVKVTVSSDKGEETLSAEVVLVAIGVRPNSEALGLDTAGVETERGWVKVNSQMQTNLKHIYAIGDLNGLLPLAHVASAQGILAVESIAGHVVTPFDKNAMPCGTYTTPQVASFGLSEQQAREAGLNVAVGTFPFLPNGKALAVGENQGFVKIVADAAEEKVVGAVIVGPEATELLPELVLAHTAGLSPEAIAKTVHAHPTLNEAVAEAAHGVFGKPLHMA